METNSLAFSLARECRKCTSHGFVLSLLHVGRSVSQSRRSAVLESINLRVSCHYRGYFFVRFAQRLLSISILALDPHTHTPARALASQIHPKAARMDCVEIRYRYCFVFSSVSYIARVELWATSSVCMHTCSRDNTNPWLVHFLHSRAREKAREFVSIRSASKATNRFKIYESLALCYTCPSTRKPIRTKEWGHLT